MYPDDLSVMVQSRARHAGMACKHVTDWVQQVTCTVHVPRVRSTRVAMNTRTQT